jgi:hypothetical protein
LGFSSLPQAASVTAATAANSSDFFISIPLIALVMWWSVA